MTEIIKLVTELLGLLKPVISPSEYDRYVKELWAIKDKNEKLRTQIKDALASGDVAALNILLSLLLGDGL
jgi:hypothetical protein